MSKVDREQYTGPAHHHWRSFNRGALLRRIDEGGDEVGPYLVVTSTFVGGIHTGVDSVRYINALEIDTSREEHVLTGFKQKIEPYDMVKEIGRFDIGEEGLARS